MNFNRRYFALAGAAAAVTGGVAFAAPASASTAACDAAAVTNGCTSINSEVPGLPDLDVLGRAAAVGQPLIVFTRSAVDPAEDFAVQLVPDGSTSTGPGPATLTTVPGTTNVRIQYAPKGALSGLCVSTVNPNGLAAAQLRSCNTVAGKYNPWQTFRRHDTGNPGDGQFVTYEELINNHLMYDPANNGSIGTVGNRVHVTFSGGPAVTHTGQLWGKNGA